MEEQYSMFGRSGYVSDSVSESDRPHHPYIKEENAPSYEDAGEYMPGARKELYRVFEGENLSSSELEIAACKEVALKQHLYQEMEERGFSREALWHAKKIVDGVGVRPSMRRGGSEEEAALKRKPTESESAT